MEIDADALKNFNDSKFGFLADGNDDADLNSVKDEKEGNFSYYYKDGGKNVVVQDQMTGHDVIATINNEFAAKENI